MLERDCQAFVPEAVSQKARPDRLALRRRFHALQNDINLVQKQVPDKVLHISYCHWTINTEAAARLAGPPTPATPERVDARIGSGRIQKEDFGTPGCRSLMGFRVAESTPAQDYCSLLHLCLEMTSFSI